MISKITWLASYPKSGSTWLRMLLAAYETQARIDINDLPRHYTFSDVDPTVYSLMTAESIGDLPSSVHMQLRGAVLIKFGSLAPGNQPAFVKTHFYEGNMCGIKAIPPELTYTALYIVRDPRDIVVSFANYTDKTLDDTIDFMINEDALVGGDRGILYSGIRSWSTHVGSWKWSDLKPHIIRYEDLCSTPNKCFEKILEHLGWEVSYPRLQAAIDTCSFEKLADQEKVAGFNESSGGQFFNKGKSGGWKKILSEAQSKKLEKAFSVEMVDLGYLT